MDAVTEAPVGPGIRARRLLASARLRIVLWYVALLALALVASLLAVRQLLLAGVEERVQADLEQEVEELRRLAGGIDPADGEPFGDRLDRIFAVFLGRNLPAEHETMLSFVDGASHLRSLDDPPVRLDRQPELVARWASLTESERGEVTLDEVGEVDYLAVPLRAGPESRGVFVVAAFTDLHRQEVHEVVRVSALVGAGALLLGILLAWSVSGRVLAPVRSLTSTARTITETDLGARIEVIGDDEVGQLADTFNAMLDRLELAFTTQRHFIDDAGHELRTPITIIRGHLELLEDDPDDREETVALVLDELDRMGRMVEDLLLLAKAQRPDFLHLDVVDLAALTREVHAKAEAIAPRAWQLESVADAHVVADRQRMTQALVQLAQNAAEHTGEGDVIGIGSALRGREALLWVRDEGPGVPSEDLDRIFDRFSRGSSARRTEGAGLGLAIVQAIADAHEGSVDLHCPPGGGAAFTLRIPVDPDPREMEP